MKAVRTWLLLLLVVLLPIRGAVAAAMLCPAGSMGGGGTSELRIHAHPPVDDLAHGTAHDRAGHHGEHHGGGQQHDEHDEQDSLAADKCNMCSAYCSLTPMANEAPQLPEPLAPAGIKFAAVLTPAPSFLSEGQERPPRTI